MGFSVGMYCQVTIFDVMQWRHQCFSHQFFHPGLGRPFCRSVCRSLVLDLLVGLRN
jgi:hypothetical protein